MQQQKQRLNAVQQKNDFQKHIEKIISDKSKSLLEQYNQAKWYRRHSIFSIACAIGLILGITLPLIHNIGAWILPFLWSMSPVAYVSLHAIFFLAVLGFMRCIYCIIFELIAFFSGAGIFSQHEGSSFIYHFVGKPVISTCFPSCKQGDFNVSENEKIILKIINKIPQLSLPRLITLT